MVKNSLSITPSKEAMESPHRETMEGHTSSRRQTPWIEVFEEAGHQANAALGLQQRRLELERDKGFRGHTSSAVEHMDMDAGGRTFIDLEHQPWVGWPRASRSLAKVVLMGQSPVEITVEPVKMLRQGAGNLPCPDRAVT